MRRISLLCLLLLFMSRLSAQVIPGDVLVLLQPGHSPEDLYRQYPDLHTGAPALHTWRRLSPDMPIWHLRYDPAAIPAAELLQMLRRSDAVQLAQLNHRMEHRLLPNDGGLSQQWQYINTGSGGGVPDADLDADNAWDLATGGLSPLGDTLVIAVIDDGVDTTHADLTTTFWHNYHEIPGNSLDDDLNGYVDDARGYNAYDLTDDISGGAFGGWHGTSVAGIVGAQGDNGMGVTGVNWEVQMMIVVGGGSEADAVAAYSYVLAVRKQWNQTQGQRGACVVAANSSWGINLGQPADAPLWCAMYDSLGKYGVLSCGATANASYNVDVQGDLPTACPSDYLITVTNVNKSDMKVNSAGYGLTTIDLGSFGEDAFTASFGNNYANFGGTSGATPHVTGAVGLLYNYNCPAFAQLSRDDPDSAAALAKRFILDGTDPNTSLDGITVTGGRQNLHKMLLELESWCILATAVTPSLPAAEGPALYGIYPNPAATSTQAACSGAACLEIRDVQGRLLSRVPVAGTGRQLLALPVEDLPAGLYLVQALDAEGRRSLPRRMLVR